MRVAVAVRGLCVVHGRNLVVKLSDKEMRLNDDELKCE